MALLAGTGGLTLTRSIWGAVWRRSTPTRGRDERVQQFNRPLIDFVLNASPSQTRKPEELSLVQNRQARWRHWGLQRTAKAAIVMLALCRACPGVRTQPDSAAGFSSRVLTALLTGVEVGVCFFPALKKQPHWVWRGLAWPQGDRGTYAASRDYISVEAVFCAGSTT